MEKVKGVCENCGHAFCGEIKVRKDGAYPTIACPKCGEGTDNFDEAETVDELNRVNEHEPIEYVESTLTAYLEVHPVHADEAKDE